MLLLVAVGSVAAVVLVPAIAPAANVGFTLASAGIVAQAIDRHWVLPVVERLLKAWRNSGS